MSNETFKGWEERFFQENNRYCYRDEIWNHQQKKIDELQQALGGQAEIISNQDQRIKDLEENLKLKTSNEVQASVNADCLVQARRENEELKAKLVKAVEYNKTFLGYALADRYQWDNDFLLEVGRHIKTLEEIGE